MKTSLLITTFNRSPLLEKSLERLTHLTLPDEVLVVDDGSIDATEQVCKGFKERLPIRYIYNHNPKHSICSFARNIGVKNTDCEIIITAEPELLFVTDIVSQMLKKRKEFPNHIISVGTVYHAQEYAYIRDKAYNDPMGFLKDEIVENYIIEPRPYDTHGFVKTVNMQATFCALYEKSWIEAVGGWDEGFKGSWGWDDVDICTRLRIKGYNQVISKEMECIHQCHPHLLPHLMGEASKLNEDYLISKKLNEVIDKNDERLIANKSMDWGIIIKK